MRIPSPPSSVSGSSTETASVSTVGPSQAQQEAREALARSSRPADLSAKLPTVAVAIPAPIPEEEEEERRSRQPTPANSLVAAFRMQVPPAQKAEPVPSPVFASHEPPSSTATPSTGKSPSISTETSPSPPSPSEESPKSPDGPNASRHPTRAQRVSFDGMQEQAGTLVNRAAEIVQSARGFLGSIWN